MKTKNAIMTVVIAGLFGISLLTAPQPAALSAQPEDCGYGQRHCVSLEECVDLGSGWVDPITKWLLGLVLDLCVEYHYYYR